MLRIDTQPHQLMTPAAADRLAAELNDTDDWTYKAIHDPAGTGQSFIEVYDEHGAPIGRL